MQATTVCQYQTFLTMQSDGKTSTLTCPKLPLSAGAIIKTLRGTYRGKLCKPLNEAFNNTATLAVSERCDVSPPQVMVYKQLRVEQCS